MSESTLTAQTAPRDRNALMNESPFQLRLLATKIGGFTTDAQKMAWHDLKSKDAQVDYVIKLLQAWDQANPGAAAPPPPVQSPPMQQAPTANGAMSFHQPPMHQAPPAQPYAPPGIAPHQPIPAAMMQQPLPQAPQVPQVSQAAAQQAAAATETKSRRSPRTNADTAQGADVGTDLINAVMALKASSDAQIARYDQFQSYVTGVLQEASDAKTSRVTALETKYAEIHAVLQQTNQYLQSVSQVQIWTLMAFLTFMQENMHASMPDLLGAAIGDSATFEQLVNKATGKA
jgi:hypothetical protein